MIANDCECFANGRINMEDKVIYRELSYTLTGILFKVHSELGNRYHERYYERAVALALRKAGVSFKEQVEVPLKYEGEKIGKYRLDFIVDDKIVLELKAEPRIGRAHITQVLAYLKANQMKLGIIANFRTEQLTFRRIINSDLNHL